MLVYYQDFGSSRTYRIQNYSPSLSVLKDASTPALSRVTRRLPRAYRRPARGGSGRRA